MWLEDSLSPHHRSGVLPLGQFIEDSQQVNAGKQVSPAKLVVVSRFLQEYVIISTKCWWGGNSILNKQRDDMGTLAKLSAVNSGSSCTTQYGKSSTEMLQNGNDKNRITFHHSPWCAYVVKWSTCSSPWCKTLCSDWRTSKWGGCSWQTPGVEPCTQTEKIKKKSSNIFGDISVMTQITLMADRLLIWHRYNTEVRCTW